MGALRSCHLPSNDVQAVQQKIAATQHHRRTANNTGMTILLLSKKVSSLPENQTKRIAQSFHFATLVIYVG